MKDPANQFSKPDFAGQAQMFANKLADSLDGAPRRGREG